MLSKAKDILQSYYGYTEFRKGQEAIINQVLNGKDTVAIMPTGGGKSICYQIPALLFSGITIVISPLISLMKDQVDALTNAGIPATFINSSINVSEMDERLRRMEAGEFKLIYIAPERLEATFFIELLNRVNVSLLAIDEAHCISQWGHDFRPSYLLIKKLIQQIHPKPVILALTATATPSVKDDICELLNIPFSNVILTGFGRENLAFQVIKGQERDLFIKDYIQKNEDQSGIIYAATRKEVERLYQQLNSLGVRVGKYHAGMSENERARNQEEFLYDDITIMVATSAFGMGINKSNVRYVIHYHIPKNMESYYQEAGRAGRDGLESECILLFSPQDIHIQKFFIDQSDMNIERKEYEYSKLRKMISYCHTETCFQQYILQYFGEEDSYACGKCGNCTDNRKQVEVTVEAQMVLSCIKRMNERFGKTFITKVLTGSNDKKINSLGFHQLSTYGILKEKTQKEVNEFIDFLTAEGYLRPTDGAYPVLVVTNKGISVLMGGEKVFKKERVEVKRLAQDNPLFEDLRKLRREIATVEKIPPYIIFSDQTLQEMSVRMPATNNELLQIKGVGERKLEQYGSAFLAVIIAYREQNKIENSVEINVKSSGAISVSEEVKQKEKSHHATYALLQEGFNIEEIADRRGMSTWTIESHLIRCSEEGCAIDWDKFIPGQYVSLIADAVEKAETDRLTPIKELLPDEISYFMIRAFLQKKSEVLGNQNR